MGDGRKWAEVVRGQVTGHVEPAEEHGFSKQTVESPDRTVRQK